MRALGLLSKAIPFVRRHLVSTACIGAFVFAMLRVIVAGAGPVPQEPPEGYVLESGRVSLEWNRGTRREPIELEIAEGDPTFATAIYKKIATGASYTFSSFRPGKRYFWRLVQNGRASPTASFEVSADHADF